MQHKELRIQGSGGLGLYGQVWAPDAEPRALVVITHGHGEHSGRYVNVGIGLSSRGFLVAALDLRGHGRSEGPRGLVMDWGDLHEDLRQFISQFQPEYPGVPLFLYGHSVGGLLSLSYVMQSSNDIKGVIASAPVLGKPNIPPILFQISKILSRVYPTFSMATQLDPTALSRDPAVVRAYQDDPLVHNTGTARLGTELVNTTEWVQAHAAELQYPLLLIHGAQDRLVQPADSRRFFDNVITQDKTYMDLPDGFHEPHNDLGKEKVIEAVADWIEARI